MSALASLPLRAEPAPDLDTFLRRWDALGGEPPSAFQTAGWLRSWYTTVGAQTGLRPVLLCLVQGDGQDALLLPLVARRQGLLSMVEAADLGVTDYNAPRARAGIERATWSAPALASALRQGLAGHDVLRLQKMLGDVGGPLAGLRIALRGKPCDLFGNHVEIGDDWDAWRHTLEKTVRKEFERSWRVFQRSPEARFVRFESAAEALAAHEQLEAQQRERMAALGDAYFLDRPPYRALYRDRLARGLADGSVVLTALMSGEQLVAALYGIHDGRRYVMLRVCHAGEAWKASSPGKLILERTMHHLHGQGCRYFDFAIGDYFHKRVFQVQHTPLWDGELALSLRGLAGVTALRARRALKRRAWARRLAQRLR